MKRTLLLTIAGLTALAAVTAISIVRAGDGAQSAGQTPSVQAAKLPDPVAMPDRGKKVPCGDYYFIYDFDKKPAMGTVIAKVELFTKDGKRDTSLEILGNVDMPDMRGMHSQGDQPFRLSNKGDYLLPMGIVMPGEWELLLTVRKPGAVIYRGYHRFKV